MEDTVINEKALATISYYQLFITAMILSALFEQGGGGGGSKVFPIKEAFQ